MGRRIQGFTQKLKHDGQQKKAAESGWILKRETKESSGQTDDVINISKAELVSGIVGGLAERAEKSCPTQKDTPDMEISEEFINAVAAKLQELQKQSDRAQANEQKGDQKRQRQQQSQQNENENSQCVPNKLQALVARMLLGGKGTQNQPGNDNQSKENPILAANDRVIQQGKDQAWKYVESPELKPDTTAKIASQVLAEAQYELSKELKASLQKLRQVIAESEQVAQKIGKLLQNSGDGSQKSGAGGQDSESQD